MTTIARHRLELADGRSSDILIGAGLAGQAASYESLGARRVLMVCDEELVASHGQLVRQALAGAVVETVAVAGREASKNWPEVIRLCDAMAAAGLERADALVAVGGGVITDLAGFAAGIYQRGIACVYVPTTLLAQVDASIGGKTGINLAAGKNLIGVFRQPQIVIADSQTLASLPPRHWSAGMAEVVKHAVLDEKLWQLLSNMLADTNLAQLSPEQIATLVAANVKCKAAIVAADERERGRRALLNLGHTFAHALEAALGYEGISHGEAVACGLLAACRLAAAVGVGEAELFDQVAGRLAAASHPDHPLPQRWPDHDRERLHQAMASDKKRAGHLRFVLPRQIGDVFVSEDAIAREMVDAAIDVLLM